MQAVHGTNSLEGVLALLHYFSLFCGLGWQTACKTTCNGKLAVSPVSFQVRKAQCLFQAMELIADPTYFLGQFQEIFEFIHNTGDETR